jgi:hypothetical protein
LYTEDAWVKDIAIWAGGKGITALNQMSIQSVQLL